MAREHKISEKAFLDMARHMQTEQEYQTSRGINLMIRAVNPIQIEMALQTVRKEFEERGEPLEPPKWSLSSEIPGKAAEEQTLQWFPFTPDTLDDPDDPKQTRINRARWAAYEDATERLLAAQGERRVRLFLTYGIEVVDGIPGVPEPADAQDKLKAEPSGAWLQEPQYWQTFQRIMGIEVPDDPAEIQLHWLQTAACDQIDIAEMQVMWSVMSNPGGLEPEELANFRRDLVGSVRRSVRTQLAGAFADLQSTGVVRE